MSETVTETTPAETTPEPKLGKAKLAKAKKVAAPAVNADGTPVEKKTAIPRVSPYAGLKIFLNRANEAVGPEVKNPKRPGTNGNQAFSMYVEGRTVEEQIEAWKAVMVTTKSGRAKPVGDMADIRWDKDHGFIELRTA
jgi:hypothetical protein